MFLSANSPVPISQRFCALVFNTSDFLPYIASTICFAHIIISIQIVLHHIIVAAFFGELSSHFVIKEKAFAAITTNNHHKAK